jgi:hypothetical protein
MTEFRRRDGRPVPGAHSVSFFLCENPACRRLHVLLEDRRCEPIAHFCVPDGFLDVLQREQYRAAVLRDEEP